MKKTLKIIAFVLVAAQLFAFAVSAADTNMYFADVKENRWSYANIKWAVDNGFMVGVSADKFSPAGTTTRAMVVTVLYRLAGSPETVYNPTFNDVPDGKWFSSAVVWAAKNNIVNGTSAKTFAPNNNITREQLAAIFYRYADFDYIITDGVKADISVYKDVKEVSSYAKDAMAWATEVGLINGVTEDTLSPKGNATREQFAAILNRYATCEDFEYRLMYNSPVVKSSFTQKEYAPIPNDAIIVSPDGNDSNPGTVDKPIKTFNSAIKLVKEKKKTATSEIVVAFKAGEYGTLDNITLTSEDKGSSDIPIRYTCYGDGEVVFSNGITLKGSEFVSLTDKEKALFPEKSADNVKKLRLDKYFPNGLPDGTSIFGENAPIWEARYPNKSEGIDMYMSNMLSVPTEEEHYFGMDIWIQSPLFTVLKKFGDLSGAKLVGYIMFGWRVDTFYIESYKADDGHMVLDKNRLPHDFYNYPGLEPPGIRTPQMPMDAVYVSGKPSMLDAEGEYWYDKDTNTIYVYNPVEEYSIGLTGTFLTLDDADHVTLEGLTFKNNTNTAIVCNNSEEVTYDSITMTGIGSCINIKGASDGCTIKNCDFGKFTGSCINVSPIKHTTTLESNRIVIDNNFIHNYGSSTVFANQAIIDSAIGTLISHNEFKNSPNGAIQLGTLSIIEYNIFDDMLNCGQDYGIVYTWNGITNRKNQIRYNLFMNMAPNSRYGCYIDDFTQDQEIYGNIFYYCGDCGVVLHNARNIYVHDNFFYECDLVISGFGYYDPDTGKANAGLLPDGTGWESQYNYYYNGRINEGHEGYEIWKKTFPSLYEFIPDTENAGDYYSFFSPWNSINNNFFINSSYGEDGSIWPRISNILDAHDNQILDESENPYFVDPTHGDYSVKDGVTFFNIPFEKMGRY